MLVEVESPIVQVLFCDSQFPLAALVDCESLWVRVHRICDQYMPELFDPRVGPKLWRTLGETTHR